MIKIPNCIPDKTSHKKHFSFIKECMTRDPGVFKGLPASNSDKKRHSGLTNTSNTSDDF